MISCYVSGVRVLYETGGAQRYWWLVRVDNLLKRLTNGIGTMLRTLTEKWHFVHKDHGILHMYCPFEKTNQLYMQALHPNGIVFGISPDKRWPCALLTSLVSVLSVWGAGSKSMPFAKQNGSEPVPPLTPALESHSTIIPDHCILA